MQPSFERLLVNAFGGTSLGRQVAHDVHLGDEALYSSEGVLTARTGQTLVTITLPMRPGSEAQALAIGKKLFERLGVPTAPERARPPHRRVPVRAEPMSPADAATADSKSSGFPGRTFGRGRMSRKSPGDAPDAATRIVPLKAGLTLSHAWSAAPGDYEHECLIQIVADTRSATSTSPKAARSAPIVTTSPESAGSAEAICAIRFSTAR